MIYVISEGISVIQEWLAANSVWYKKVMFVKEEISCILILAKKYVGMVLIWGPKSVKMEIFRMEMAVQVNARLKMGINAMVLCVVKYVEMEKRSKEDVMMGILKMEMAATINAKLN